MMDRVNKTISSINHRPSFPLERARGWKYLFLFLVQGVMIPWNKLYMVRKVSILFFLSLSTLSIAQISPGELARPHAHLEGISNCTKCHDLGKKVSESKCLSCHTHLNDNIKAEKGYHYSSEVRQKACIECHSDHHGRNFDIIRFDKEKFNHNLTGYELEGAHDELDCADCHNDEFIADIEIRNKDYTYLGLQSDCLSCHTDQHRGTLSTDCASCHSPNAFSPATFFDHSQSAFPLRGKHTTIDCEKCHKVTEEQGEKFQQFTGIAFNSCANCHQDEHNGQFGKNCSECHTEKSFHILKGMENFNHNKTGFPLKGKHVETDCTQCHTQGAQRGSTFKEFKNLESISCTQCHDDEHDDKFGSRCDDCHDEQSFNIVDYLDFDHILTGYKLEGKHEFVDCRKCHLSDAMTDPLPHSSCNQCHTDFHEGQFKQNNQSSDCADCHTTDGFAGSTYSIERHNLSGFILEGAHLATPCFVCHKQDEQWRFRNIGHDCIDCHADIHEGYIDSKYYPERNCANCHNPEKWNAIVFAHEQTGFVLEGAHKTQSCGACHIDESTTSGITQMFSELNSDCIECHDDIHFGQFDNGSPPDCLRCHGFIDWAPEKFEHSSTRFVLEGKHAIIDCIECHQETRRASNEEIYRYYKIDKFECVDCHG